MLTRTSAPRMKLRLEGLRDALLGAGELCVQSCLLHRGEGLPSLGGGVESLGSVAPGGPQAPRRMPSGCLGEPGWVECPWAASGHQVLSRVLSHVSSLRETQSPTLPLSRVDGLTSPWSSFLLLSQGMPGQALASVGLWSYGQCPPLQLRAERSWYPPSAAWACTRVSLLLTVSLGGMLLAAASSTLSSGGCCQAFPVPQIWTCSPASQHGDRLSREKEPCARAGPVP